MFRACVVWKQPQNTEYGQFHTPALQIYQYYMWRVTAKGTAHPTSYWFRINTFSHKRAAVFSSQEVHDIIGCKMWPKM